MRNCSQRCILTLWTIPGYILLATGKGWVSDHNNHLPPSGLQPLLPAEHTRSQNHQVGLRKVICDVTLSHFTHVTSRWIAVSKQTTQNSLLTMTDHTEHLFQKIFPSTRSTRTVCLFFWIALLLLLCGEIAAGMPVKLDLAACACVVYGWDSDDSSESLLFIWLAPPQSYCHSWSCLYDY